MTQTHVSREILTYLGNLPQKLKTQGNSAAADVALQIGNCLLWIQPNIAPGEHKVEAGLDETPTTVYALGKQLRAVALQLMEKPLTGNPNPHIQAIYHELEVIQTRLSRVEGGGL